MLHEANAHESETGKLLGKTCHDLESQDVATLSAHTVTRDHEAVYFHSLASNGTKVEAPRVLYPVLVVAVEACSSADRWN